MNDEERIAYLASHIAACAEAISLGADLRGYWLWSFIDNFEWSCGYVMRFGIVHVDYATQKRTPKASYHWYRQHIARQKAASGAAEDADTVFSTITSFD